MRCAYYDAGVCGSCTLLPQPYPAQVADKDRRVRVLLGDRGGLTWLPPVTSAEAGFRNKAKMVVAGTPDAPTLGILDPHGHGVDLQGCPLYPAALSDAFAPLAAFVTRAGLAPYDVPTRRGELKHLLVTVSPDGELMVRLVLRSTEALARVRKHLPWLRAEVPALAVASVNVQPAHAAVLEGEREEVLTERDTLRMRVNGLDLHLRPRSFFQTNTDVAAALYRQATAWADELDPRTVWDLYCGVGGFALHLARPGRTVVGVETSAEAVASAEQSAREAGLPGTRFLAGDATGFALASRDVPDLVVVNPPRRGLGEPLSRWLEASGVRRVLYSSCHAGSLARDLAAMPSLRPRRAQVLDMFPHTGHYEVLTLLERDGDGAGPGTSAAP
ncbi:23S rRNA (uracil(747)-C(5))-methyltransferase RlmC [Cellulomonas shaoxiangyii]|uniref:23S rRNA (Uracil(747)-C(5))-methyltransferase RlmC n=1 Tax=Cellulomonas shaoxiangyii TaxID=2566013 RepID=A0A4P7SMP1_9CELL|nr:23S rRNA (uracil(747)-C(5))-methyltransferase RlmC [Cellulomonas shaoxiangyii]QCB94124.1 23S rRNA (uracil(747)-C(5))-methyltransferase RlmC [Cellulomonas shaoxiangyii]TGY86617.1 23S rRNA (uracil(747)-C(5))-methyltransferase RlmC [Cellulomonas shaoxiangyii]